MRDLCRARSTSAVSNFNSLQFRRLGEIRGEPYNPLLQQLNLTDRSSFEEAQAAGEALVADSRLGDVPAQKLQEVVEDRLKIPVLYVDAHGCFRAIRSKG